MDSIGIDISGLKEMERSLLGLVDEIGAKKATGLFTSSLREGAKEFEADIKSNVNVSTYSRVVKTKAGSKVTIRPGFLKSRIKIKASTSRGKVSRKFGKNEVSRVQVGVFKVPYIVQYEYGTTRQRKDPVIRNAFKNKTHAAVRATQSKLKKKIVAAAKRIAKQKAKS